MRLPLAAGRSAASTCCRATPHDPAEHKLDSAGSSIEQAVLGNSECRMRNSELEYEVHWQALVRAVAAMRRRGLWVSELCAVAALRLAGFSSGTGMGGRISGDGTLAVLSQCLASDHACLFSFVRKKETACEMSRSYSRVGRNRQQCVLMCWCGYRSLWVHFGLVRFLLAIPTELRGQFGIRNA